MSTYFFNRFTIVKATAVSHKGKIRKNNEDYYQIILPSSVNRFKESIFILADGMGGYNKGDVASKLAVHSFIEFYTRSEERRLVNKIYTALTNANKNVYDRSVKSSQYAGMGTTIALLVIYNDLAIISNVGDSRIYHYTDNHLSQVSEDHSWVKEIGLSDEEAINHPKRNVITRTIGKNSEVIPYLHTIPIKKGDIFLLCSDGLTTHVSNENIKKILASKASLRDKQRILLKLALDGGGKDNITTILAQIYKVKSSRKQSKKRRTMSLLIVFLFLLISAIGFLFYKEGNFSGNFLYPDTVSDDTTTQNSISKIVEIDTSGVVSLGMDTSSNAKTKQMLDSTQKTKR